MIVKKRNGNMVAFDKNKIIVAIQKAMLEVNINTDRAYDITEKVLDKISDKNEISIEEIQDIIEETLIEKNYPTVAKAYILYREERKRARENQARLYEESQKQISEIMAMKNIENSNANVDEASFSGKNSKVTSYFLKEYALNNLMRPEAAKAHRDGLLYTHDLDNYASGMHNCLFIDFEDLFNNKGGFTTRNGDVRKPNDIMTFFQLVAVTFQCASQCQYGGIASNKIDYDASPYVAITFKKSFRNALMDIDGISKEHAELIMKNIEDTNGDIIKLENEKLKLFYPKHYKVAERHTIEKTMQGAESLYHNLNTLESRAGSQVPFTSINFGTDTSPEGRLVSKALLTASINGIGKFNKTSIFPISIFKYAKGINDKEGTPNYDLKLLALESLSKRIYPNFCNVTIEGEGDINDPDTQSATIKSVAL